jgi:4-hydroxy-tetrahydrodipicolinate synthase
MTKSIGAGGKNMADKLVKGVYAALLTPRLRNGDFDGNSYRNQLEFLLGKGIEGFALNGATSEYSLITPEELKKILEISKETLANRADFICGVGAATLRAAVKLGQLAMEGGATGLLLPMPYFFPYSQDDLGSFCNSFAKQIPLPILLYNLPMFTSGLEASTVLDLIQQNENIVGIKDSSGSLDILRAITESGLECTRVVGNDSALAPALCEGLCEGVISGVSCVLPEILKAMVESAPGSAEFERMSELLNVFTAQLNRFPTPWCLKFISESRKITSAWFPFPLSEGRAAEGAKLVEWFKLWKTATIDSIPAMAMDAG